MKHLRNVQNEASTAVYDVKSPSLFIIGNSI